MISFSGGSVFLFLMGLSTSQAFVPSQDFYIGIEPQRIYRYHIEQQHKFRNNSDWQGFVSGTDGFDWKARFDEFTGLPYKAWGGGIDLGTLNSSNDALVQIGYNGPYGPKALFF